MSDITVIPSDMELDFTLQPELELAPVDALAMTRYEQEFRSAKNTLIFVIWIARTNGNWKKAHADMSWDAYCETILSMSRKWANDFYATYEANRSLPKHLHIKAVSQSRVVCSIPKDHRVDVLQKAHDTARIVRGIPIKSAAHIMATWKEAYPNDRLAATALLDSEDFETTVPSIANPKLIESIRDVVVCRVEKPRPEKPETNSLAEEDDEEEEERFDHGTIYDVASYEEETGVACYDTPIIQESPQHNHIRGHKAQVEYLRNGYENMVRLLSQWLTDPGNVTSDLLVTGLIKICQDRLEDTE